MLQSGYMPPEHTGNPPQANPQNAAAEHARVQQLRAHFENRLRIKKSAKTDKEGYIHDIDRDVEALSRELHHVEMEEKRLNDEVRKTSQEIRQETGEKKNLDMGLRETTQSLSRKEDEMRKLDREIEGLKHQIEEKEREKAAIKEETRHLARDKEEFRRGGELGHFTVKGEEGRLHEVQVKLQLLAQERLRKENEFKHKEDMQKEIHREINFMEQEISQLEVELSRLTHPGT